MRPLVALLTCWLVLLRAEPVPLHACAMHDGAAHVTMHGGGAHDGTGAVGATRAHDAAHAAHHADHASASADAHTPEPAHDASTEGCLCLGCCGGVPVVATVSVPPLAWLASILDVEPVLAAPGARRLPAPRDDVALPYPNAPPAGLVA